MGLDLLAIGGGSVGRKTETAGTVINRLVPPKPNAFTRVTTLRYTAAGTAHIVTAMAPLGKTTLSAAAAASQAVIVLTAQPVTDGTNNVAANDWLAWDNGDGTYSFGQVSSVSGLTITMTANLPKAVAAGQTVWMFGAIGDTNPYTGFVHPGFTGTASATETYTDTVAGVFSSNNKFEPLLLQSDNATAAGTMQLVSYVHTLN